MARSVTLTPMLGPNGERMLVNHWDVKSRQREGWEILEDLTSHVTRVETAFTATVATGESEVAEEN